MCRMSWKSGSLNLLEPSGPHRACYGTALPFLLLGGGGRLTPLSDRFTPENDSGRIVTEVCWSQGSFWTGAENIASHRDTKPLTVYPLSSQYPHWAIPDRKSSNVLYNADLLCPIAVLLIYVIPETNYLYLGQQSDIFYTFFTSILSCLIFHWLCTFVYWCMQCWIYVQLFCDCFDSLIMTP